MFYSEEYKMGRNWVQNATRKDLNNLSKCTTFSRSKRDQAFGLAERIAFAVRPDEILNRQGAHGFWQDAEFDKVPNDRAVRQFVLGALSK